MAALDLKKPRNVIAAVIVAFAGGALVIGGMAGSFFGGAGGIVGGVGANEAARVGDVRISSREFQQAWRRSLADVQRSNPGITEDVARSVGLVQQVFQQLAIGAQLQQEAEALRIAAPDAVVARELGRIPAFQNPVTGAFDPERYRQILANQSPPQTPARFEDLVREDLAAGQVDAMVTTGLTAPTGFTAALLRARSERRIVTAVVIPPSLDEISPPDDAALQTIFDQDPSLYNSPETRNVTVAYFAPDRDAALGRIDPEQLELLVAEAVAEAGEAATRTFVEITAPDEATAAAAAERLAGGADPDALAAEIAGVQANRYDAAARTDVFDPAVAQAAFSLGVGEVSAPIETALSWSVVRMETIVSDVEADPVAIRAEVTDTLLAEIGASQVAEAVRAFERALDAAATLEQAAEAAGAPLYVAENAHAPGASDPANPDLPEANDALPALPEEDANTLLTRAFSQRERVLSPLITLADDRLAFIRVNAVTPSTARSLEDVRDTLVATWFDQELERAQQRRAEAARQVLNQGGAPNAAAEAAGGEVSVVAGMISRLRQPPERLGDAIARASQPLAPGETAIIPREDGALATVRLEAVLPAPPLDARALRGFGVLEELDQALGGDLRQLYYQSLAQRYRTVENQRVISAVTGAGQE